MIRLLRIVKLYKQAKLAQKKQEDESKKRQNRKSLLVRRGSMRDQMAAANAIQSNAAGLSNMNISREMGGKNFQTIQQEQNKSANNQSKSIEHNISNKEEKKQQLDDSLDMQLKQIEQKHDHPQAVSGSIQQ